MTTKKDYYNSSNYDMKDQYDEYFDDEQEYETADTFVENIDDNDDGDDDNENFTFKYRSSTQKST